MKKNNTLKTKLEYYFSSTCGIFLTERSGGSPEVSRPAVGRAPSMTDSISDQTSDRQSCLKL